MNRNDCIHLLRQAGVSENDAINLVDELYDEKARVRDLGGNIQDLGTMWSQRAQEYAREVQRKEYLHALGALRYVENARRMDSAFQEAVRLAQEQGLNDVQTSKYIASVYNDTIQSILVGQTKWSTGGRDSVSAIRDGVRASWYAPMLKELEAIDGGLDLVREDKQTHDNVLREMRERGSTSDQTARQIADIFARYAEQARVEVNRWGGGVGKIEGWTPQSHDPFKMMSRDGHAQEAWKDFIYDRLDWDKTFPDLQTKEERMAALDRVYDDITIGRNPSIPATDWKPSVRAKASKHLEHHRVLHFRDADAAIEYNDKYGKGNIFDAMVSHFESEARAVSLLQKLGPNPRLTINKLVQKAELDLRALKGTLAQEDIADALQKIRLNNEAGGLYDRWYKQLTGEINIPGWALLAKVGATLRSIENMAKLGGATLSAIADPFIRATSLRYMGENWFEAIRRSIGDYLGAFPKDERAEIARQGGAFMESLRNEIASRWDDNSGLPGSMFRLQNKFFKWSGLNWITERGKAAHTVYLSGYLGEAAGKAFADLDDARKALFKYHNIDANRWEIMRKMTKEINGQKYFDPSLASQLTEADLMPLLYQKYQNQPANLTPESLDRWKRGKERNIEEVRQRINFESRGFLVDETRNAIIEPDDWTRALMNQGQKPGTWAGEWWRAVSQFKGFPLAYMQRILGGRRWIRAERQAITPRDLKGSVAGDIPGVVGFLLTSVAFGYAAGMLKDLAKNRTPRDPRKMETWFAALMQSGGAGILGDVFFGEVDRFGNPPIANIAGPLAGSIAGTGGLAQILQATIHGDAKKASHDAVRFGVNHLPFVNLWYTREAVNWAALYHIREMLSPGSLRRSERDMKERFNQTNIFSPARHIRYGGGF